jgi:NAD(P)-dependent dehydrogenase (short-subunit alcohol dehydrogenase family)
MERLNGRVALVTGAASGIGHAIAIRLAQEGAAVVVTDIQDEPGEAVAKGIRETGGGAVFVHHDVVSPVEWERAVGSAAREFGGLDIFGTSGGFGTSPAYHAAKGAVRTLTKNTALHWADKGIRVNSVHPGFIDTPILASTKGTEFEQAMIGLTPMGRLGRPQEIAAGVAYLASDDASFVTGLELYIDGGYMAR